MKAIVDNSETIVRILHRYWVVDGVLQTNAFALDEGETYISVNRPIIDSCESDISSFVRNHPLYRVSGTDCKYRRAEMSVADVRALSVSFEGKNADVSVEVEPRDAHYSMQVSSPVLMGKTSVGKIRNTRLTRI